MVLKRLFGSKTSRSVTVISALAQAAREFRRGDSKAGALLVALGALAYRSTVASILAQGFLWWYRRRGSAAESAGASEEIESVMP
ncbi:hypothetical protein [Natronoarchaeum rubrum]|uniref:hypothetical protein n=1 Tax=Natronoarchaeum rubrum TaxID=755311 RepID=UPI00211249FE|nr:hypothetical protein [Natronoarchaeum rubrum]